MSRVKSLVPPPSRMPMNLGGLSSEHMARKIVEFKTDKRFARRTREWKTLEAMLRMYCRRHHGGEALCEECDALAQYARRRLGRCVFGDAKPTCANCVVHCYRAEMRERVREVMRWAGPRMLFRHPVLAILHMADGRRPSVLLPGGARPACLPEQSGEADS